MKTIFRPKSTFSFAGLLWLYIFVSLSYFQIRPVNTGELNQGSSASLNANVHSASKYQQATEISYVYVQYANNYVTFDLDDGLAGIPTTSHSAVHPLIKNISAYSPLHLKNSPLTIRMISSVLLV